MKKTIKRIVSLSAVVLLLLSAVGCNADTTPIDVPPAVTYTVAVAAAEHGTVSTDVKTVAEGDSVAVTLVPDDGYYASALTVNGKRIDISGNTATVCDVQEDITVGAEFAFGAVTVSFKTAVDDELQPIQAAYGLPYGPLPVAAKSGDKQFVGWSYDNRPVDETTAVAVKGDHALTAEYRALTSAELTRITPFALTVAYYDAFALSLGVSFHTKDAPLNAVVQICEGDAFDETAAKTVVCDSKSWETEYVHQAVIDTLTFGTTYTYRVGDRYADRWTDAHTLTTRRDTVESRFIYLADTQQSLSNANMGISLTDGAAILQAAQAAHDFDYVVHGGDFVDKGDNSLYWGEMLGDMESVLGRYPLVFAQGNHECDDYYCQQVPELFQAMFNVNYPEQSGANNGAYYSLDIGAMHLIVMRSNDAYKGGRITEEQVQWLTTDLAAANANAKTKWNVVVMHEGIIFPASQAGNSNNHMRNTRGVLMPVFRAGKVDLVLQAHTHKNYTTYPLDYESDGSVVEEDNIPHYVKNAVNISARTVTENERGESMVSYTGYRSGTDGTVFHEPGSANRQYNKEFDQAESEANKNKWQFYDALYSGGANLLFGDELAYGFYDYIEITEDTLTLRSYAVNYDAWMADRTPARFVYGLSLSK